MPAPRPEVPAPRPEVPARPMPTVFRLALQGDTPFLVDKGLPSEVFVLQANSTGLPVELASSAPSLLYELLRNDENLWSSIEYLDDHDWANFPELAEAFKAAGGEVLGLCIAVHPELPIWAVAAASNKKARLSTARAALCLALLAETELESFERFVTKWPAFADLCDHAGLSPEGYSLAPPVSRKAEPRGRPAASPAKVSLVSRAELSALVSRGELEHAELDKPMPTMTRLRLPPDMQFLLERGLPNEVWALLVAQQGLPTELSSNASHLLLELLENDEEAMRQIDYVHDADWEHFPEIGQAVKAAGGEEFGLCLAILADVWAVAVASKKKARETAARTAVCLALLTEADDATFGRLKSKWPAFAAVVEDAGVVHAGASAPPGGDEECPEPPGLRILLTQQPPPGGDEEPPPPPAKRPRVAAAAPPLQRPTRRPPAGPAAVLVKREALGDPEDGLAGPEQPVQRPSRGEVPGREAFAGNHALQPLWLELAEDAEIPTALDDMLAQALALCGDVDPRLQGRVDSMLRYFMPSLGVADAQFKDVFKFVDEMDEAKGTFNIVQNELTQMGAPEGWMCVAVCKECGLWGVGLGNKRGTRLAAAKLALVCRLAINAEDTAGGGPFESIIQEHPAIADILDACKVAKPF